MNASNTSLLRTAALAVSAILLLGRGQAAEADAFPTFENRIKFSAAGAAFNDGSKAAAQRRTHLPSMGAGGIEAFSYNREISKETSWQVDGKALGNAGDYLAQFAITKNEVGSFEAGYKRFRTFYDGAGGFFPIGNSWLPIFQRATYVDRGNFYLNAKVELPKAPVYTLRYSNQTRTGRKDSTIMGETDQTGIPIWSLASLNPVPAARKIVPAYLQLNERQQTLEGSIQKSFGRTTASLTLVGTRINNNDTRAAMRYFGEIKPYPAIPANPPTLVSPLLANNETGGYEQLTLDEKAWTLVGKVETAVSENLTAYAGVNYHHSSGDFAVARAVSLSIMTAAGRRDLVGGFTPGGRPPYSHDTAGTMKVNVYTANAGVQMKPMKDLRVDAGVKAEDYTAIGKSDVNYINNQVTLATGVVVPMPVTTANASRNSEKVWSPEIDARYTGIKRVSFFGSWTYRSSPGDERVTYGSLAVNTTAGTVGPGLAVFSDKVKEKHANYKVGANWTPFSAVVLRSEYYAKDHQNRFDGYGTSAGGLYVLDYDIYGTKSTVTLRVTPELSLTTRYVTQRGRSAVADDTFTNPEGAASGDSRRYEIAETISWNPSKVWYVQADLNRVYDRISTAYPYATGLALGVIRNADNNYWNGSLLTGFVIDKLTNAQVQGTYYKADNYNRAMAATTLPYGAGGREYSISAGVTRKFSNRWMGSAKIGYFDSRNDTTGGFTNFRRPLACFSIEHAL
jgi:hypothetical protein